ncbi:MAG: GAF domain-containing protein [Bacteroidaceae bacterium]
MSEEIIVSQGSKEDKYELLYSQIKGLIEGESNLVANMSNATAAISMTFDFLWIGFYFVDKYFKKEEILSAEAMNSLQLVLGPFQGPVACTRIKYATGVCGTAWAEGKSITVGDVNTFPGHIACSSDSLSEIVVPIIDLNNRVRAVLDIDSRETNTFDKVDERGLEKIATLFIPFF